MMKLLLAGYGQIASALAERLPPDLYSCVGLSRSARIAQQDVRPLQADLEDPDSLRGLALEHFDATIITLTPRRYDDESYRQIYEQGLSNLLQTLRTDFLLFVSSTSVYHQGSDEWVDENSATDPEHFSGRRLLAAETMIRDQGVDNSIVRFSGIYGGRRTRFVEQVLEGRSFSDNYSNRIHEEDCVGFLAHLLTMRLRSETVAPRYLASDSLPSRLSTVSAWIRQQCEVSVRHSAQVDAPRAVRRGSSKRCRNTLMTNSGYRLVYPDFREGYAEVLAARARK